jgi:hypothetical protein
MKIYGNGDGIHSFPPRSPVRDLGVWAKHEYMVRGKRRYLTRRARQDRSFLKEAEIEMSQERQEQAAEDRKLLEEIMQYENFSLGMSDDELNELDARMSMYKDARHSDDDYPYDSSYDDGDI